MKYTIGDRIILKRTGEEGTVIAYVDKVMVEVEVNGTTFPVYLDDVDHPYLKWFTEKTPKKKSLALPELPVEKPALRTQRLAKGVYLSFLPVFKTDGIDEVVEMLKVYLLNETPAPVRFSYDCRLLNQSTFRLDGTLHGFGNLYLHNIDYVAMSDQPRFQWLLADAQNTGLAPVEDALRIKPAKLFELVNKVQTTGDPTFSFLLVPEFLPKKKPEPEEKPIPPATAQSLPLVTSRTIEPAKYELDLHVEALLDNKKGLTNTDIILLQLNTLKKYLQLAIVHRQERMIVIHGLGKGKLRDEVHAVLKQTPEVSRYKNEWSGKYGFGATEVLFRY